MRRSHHLRDEVDEQFFCFSLGDVKQRINFIERLNVTSQGNGLRRVRSERIVASSVSLTFAGSDTAMSPKLSKHAHGDMVPTRSASLAKCRKAIGGVL